MEIDALGGRIEVMDPPVHGEKTSKPKAPPKEEDPETICPMEKRLIRLADNDQLPGYVTLASQPPKAWEASPTGYAIQAEREWPAVAVSLSIPVGKIEGYTEFGVIVKTKANTVLFDIKALWKELDVA